MEKIRIAKFIAAQSSHSRRKVEDLILDGEISVNGVVIQDPATKVCDEDKIEIFGKVLKTHKIKEQLYVFYKPKGCICSKSDEQDRKTIYDVLPSEFKDLLYIGRLDFNTEGLLLLTNSGELKNKFEHPSAELQRVYKVKVFGREKLKDSDLTPLRKGLKFKEADTGKLIQYKPFTITILENENDVAEPKSTWCEIKITEGKNKEIRNAFEQIGFIVSRLIRISYGAHQLGQMSEGEIFKAKTDFGKVAKIIAPREFKTIEDSFQGDAEKRIMDRLSDENPREERRFSDNKWSSDSRQSTGNYRNDSRSDSRGYNKDSRSDFRGDSRSDSRSDSRGKFDRNGTDSRGKSSFAGKSFSDSKRPFDRDGAGKRPFKENSFSNSNYNSKSSEKPYNKKDAKRDFYVKEAGIKSNNFYVSPEERALIARMGNGGERDFDNRSVKSESVGKRLSKFDNAKKDGFSNSREPAERAGKTPFGQKPSFGGKPFSDGKKSFSREGAGRGDAKSFDRNNNDSRSNYHSDSRSDSRGNFDRNGADSRGKSSFGGKKPFNRDSAEKKPFSRDNNFSKENKTGNSARFERSERPTRNDSRAAFGEKSSFSGKSSFAGKKPFAEKPRQTGKKFPKQTSFGTQEVSERKPFAERKPIKSMPTGDRKFGGTIVKKPSNSKAFRGK